MRLTKILSQNFLRRTISFFSRQIYIGFKASLALPWPCCIKSCNLDPLSSLFFSKQVSKLCMNEINLIGLPSKCMYSIFGVPTTCFSALTMSMLVSVLCVACTTGCWINGCEIVGCSRPVLSFLCLLRWIRLTSSHNVGYVVRMSFHDRAVKADKEARETTKERLLKKYPYIDLNRFKILTHRRRR